MSLTTPRLSPRQITLVKHLAVCTGKGAQVPLSPHQREAATPLWRRGLVEVWYRVVPDEGGRGPFYRLSHHGRLLAATLAAGAEDFKRAAS